MTLPESPLGAELRVTGLRLPAADAFRLSEMGIRLGTLAHVTQHAALADGSSPWRGPGLRWTERLRPSSTSSPWSAWDELSRLRLSARARPVSYTHLTL